MSGWSPKPRRVPTQVAALALGVSESTIRQWVYRGKLTRYGTARHAEFDIDELTELVGDRTPGPR